MRNLVVAAMLAPLLHSPGLAAQPLNERQVQGLLTATESIENRIDGDLNGDGRADTAFVTAAGTDGPRSLKVFFAGQGAAPHAAGQLSLPQSPIGPAELTVENGVLVVHDVTGGTTAVAATYRFRGEPGAARMRLIGIDAKYLSRTFAHDGSELSWNLLTGDVISSQLKAPSPGTESGYQKTGLKRTRRSVSTIYMEDTPDAEDLFAAIPPPR